ncbi:hypothetical protein QQZ08_000992 [Neonectria magnoliae]|uniref:Uncharacterized protein n=1 Tax=Neonectria magnoliae TaxID=2732573 RepID=A0ABR1IFQ3_9HYPO
MNPRPKRYSVSNLYKILVARELARIFPYSETGVVINFLSPGLCNTGLADKVGIEGREVFLREQASEQGV